MANRNLQLNRCNRRLDNSLRIASEVAQLLIVVMGCWAWSLLILL